MKQLQVNDDKTLLQCTAGAKLASSIIASIRPPLTPHSPPPWPPSSSKMFTQQLASCTTSLTAIVSSVSAFERHRCQLHCCPALLKECVMRHGKYGSVLHLNNSDHHFHQFNTDSKRKDYTTWVSEINMEQEPSRYAQEFLSGLLRKCKSKIHREVFACVVMLMRHARAQVAEPLVSTCSSRWRATSAAARTGSCLHFKTPRQHHTGCSRAELHVCACSASLLLRAKATRRLRVSNPQMLRSPNKHGVV